MLSKLLTPSESLSRCFAPDYLFEKLASTWAEDKRVNLRVQPANSMSSAPDLSAALLEKLQALHPKRDIAFRTGSAQVKAQFWDEYIGFTDYFGEVSTSLQNITACLYFT